MRSIILTEGYKIMFVIGPTSDLTNRVLGSFVGAIAILAVVLQIFS